MSIDFVESAAAAEMSALSAEYFENSKGSRSTRFQGREREESKRGEEGERGREGEGWGRGEDLEEEEVVRRERRAEEATMIFVTDLARLAAAYTAFAPSTAMRTAQYRGSRVDRQKGAEGDAR
jgi:hypothetical protein